MNIQIDVPHNNRNNLNNNNNNNSNPLTPLNNVSININNNNPFFNYPPNNNYGGTNNINIININTPAEVLPINPIIPVINNDNNNNNNDNNDNNENNVEGGDAAAPRPVPLANLPNARRVLAFAVGCIVITALCTLLSCIVPWFSVPRIGKFYAQDKFLWLFLLPPLSAVFLLFSSVTVAGRICWLHCWTVTVISIDVPSAVIFVSFGTSLVYSGGGNVWWDAGAFLVLWGHVTSIVAGLLFMKLAQILELGPPPPAEDERPPPGPITVSIGSGDSFLEIEEERKNEISSKYRGGAVIVGTALHASI